MAEGAAAREREIRAGFRLQLADCVYFCLHYAYPLHHVSAFVREFQRDWNMNAFAVWAGAPDSEFAVFGQSTNPAHRRRVPDGRAGPAAARKQAIADHTPADVFDRCATLFERILDTWGFVTPGTSKTLRSTMTVYQEVGIGTCWLAAVLNLLLHVPQMRTVLWNAVNRKLPKMEDTTLDFFVTTPVGRSVYERYSQRVQHATNRPARALETTSSQRAGYPEMLMEALQDVVPDLRDLRPFPHGTRVAAALRSALRAPDEDTARTLLRALEGLIPIMGAVGGLLSGTQTAAGAGGHAVAICIDADRPDTFRVHNHGVSGRELTLAHFLGRFAHNAELIMYHVEPISRLGLP